MHCLAEQNILKIPADFPPNLEYAWQDLLIPVRVYKKMGGGVGFYVPNAVCKYRKISARLRNARPHARDYSLYKKAMGTLDGKGTRIHPPSPPPPHLRPKHSWPRRKPLKKFSIL